MRVQANKAALKALFMNRVGDIGYLIGLVFVFFGFKSVNFSVLIVILETVVSVPCSLDVAVTFYDMLLVDVIAGLFFVGVVGKSAQITLHT